MTKPMTFKPEPGHIYALTLLYFAVSLAGIWHHEFFVDEAHHWLLARDSGSVSELVANTRIEGHPLLWSLLLFALTRFTADPFWMQFLNIVISTSTVFLFLRKAPFSWAFKTLFIFGYFMLFEYNLISRNYMLGIWFLFWACSVFADRQRKFPLLCLFLALSVNVHLMFSMIAFALFLTLLFENALNRQLFRRAFIPGYLIFILGLASIILLIRHTDSDWLLEPIRQLPISERLVKGAASPFKGLINVPDFRTMYFWNSNYIVNAFRPVALAFTVGIYLLPLLVFFKNRKTIFFVYTGLLGTQIFFFITQRAATRFHGMTFIIFIVALWIEDDYSSENYKFKDWLQSLRLTRFKQPIVYGILTLQLFSGIYAYAMDYVYPFTSAREAVDFFRKNGLDRREIVTVSCDGTLLSAYLERKIWFLCDGGYQSFCHWDSQCARNLTTEKTRSLLSDYIQSHEDAIFVSYYPVLTVLTDGSWISLNDKIQYRFLKKFDVNMVDKSDLYVFEVSKK